MCLKEVHVVVLPHMETNISCNGSKCVTNCIMGYCAQCKRWIPIWSLECVHMHQGILVIEGWGNPSCI